jgi:hypothetical protein
MTASRDELEGYDRVSLQKLLLAVDIILRLGEESDIVANALESDLWVLKDRAERALLER